jgi:O-antigen ligase
VKLSARTIAALGAIGFAFGNVGRIPTGALGGRNTPVVFADVIVALLWLVLVLAVASRAVPVAVDRVMSAVGAFLIVAGISTASAFSRYKLGFAEGMGVLAFLARWIAYFGWYPFIAWCLSPAESRAAWRDVERALFVVALFGIFQSAFLPGFAQMLYSVPDLPSWDVQGRRLVSTMLDPNFAGILIVIALLFRLARIAEDERDSGIAMTLLGVALLLTVSRSALLALAVGLIVLAAIRGLRLRLFRLMLLAALLVLPFTTLLLSFAAGFNKLTYDASAAQRLIPWTRAVRLLIEHPWIGVGFNAIQPAQESHGWPKIGGADVSLDGGLLFVAAMTGILGLFFYLVIVARVWGAARRAWRDKTLERVDRAHATATVAATSAIIVHSFFVNSLLLPFVMQVMWVMWARLAQITTERRRIGRLVAAGGAAIVVAGLAGCDPCAGTVSCSTASHAALTGTIVSLATGEPVPGAHVDVAFTAASGFNATGSAVTNAEGLWLVSADTPGGQQIEARVTVGAPGGVAYTIPGFPVRTSTIAGDATVVGQWTDVPFAHYLATLSPPVAGAALAFTVTGGAPVTSMRLDPASNGGGQFEFDFTATQLGNVVGTLTVSGSSLAQPVVLKGLTIPLDYHYGIALPLFQVPLASKVAAAPISVSPSRTKSRP